jgi:hypothetical protein
MTGGTREDRALAPRVLLLVLVAAGCAGRRPPAELLPPDRAHALDQLARRGERPILFDGEVRLSGRHRGARLRARALAVVEPDGRFYLETVEGPRYVVASDGGRIRVILAAEREWLEAPTTVAAMEALFGLPLLPDELGALLGGTGVPPRLLAVAQPDGAHRLRFPGGSLELDAAESRPIAGENRGLVFRQPRPDRLTVAVPARRLALEIELRPTPGAVVGRAPGLFRPEPPPAFRQVRLSDLTAPVLLPAGDQR